MWNPGQSTLYWFYTIIATVARQGEGLIREVKLRPDSRLVEVTPANRQALSEELVRWLEKRLASC